MVKIGKCPACETELEETDVDDIYIRGTVNRHFAYRCRHCDTVIGFSSHSRY